MITRPLDLESRISPPPRDLNFVAWVNVGLIVLFFGLLGSRFVLPPAVPVDVGGLGALVLPSSVLVGENNGVAASVVVSYRRDNVILFEGGMYSLPELRKHMGMYAKEHPGAVMLVRADRQVSLQAFLDLCAMAREVGFARVQVAAEKPATENAPK